MKDTANNVNVGDVITLKAKVLIYYGYCPGGGHRYRLQLLSNNGLNLTQVAIDISDPGILLSKEPTTTASVFRPFKAGDIAQCVEVRNRKPNCGIGEVNVRLLKGDIVTVITNEADTKNSTVKIKFQDGIVAAIDPVYLEMLIPVEELHPYYVAHNPGENAFEVCRTVDGKPVTRMCYFYKEGTHEGEESFCYAEMTEAEAEQAAEDERDRLNEDWRKHRQHSSQ
jgi:hypothetical protein